MNAFCYIYQVFEGIVKSMLVNNGHRATVESVPNTELEAAIDSKEKGKLDEVKKSMSEQVKQNVTEPQFIVSSCYFYVSCSSLSSGAMWSFPSSIETLLTPPPLRLLVPDHPPIVHFDARLLLTCVSHAILSPPPGGQWSNDYGTCRHEYPPPPPSYPPPPPSRTS